MAALGHSDKSALELGMSARRTGTDVLIPIGYATIPASYPVQFIREFHRQSIVVLGPSMRDGPTLTKFPLHFPSDQGI